MKKLGIIFLATVFVFGLAIQAGADVTPLGEDAFYEDDPITFDDFADQTQCTEIKDQYAVERGVVFSGGLYGESFISANLMSDLFTATNFNVCNLSTEVTIPAPAITATFVEPVTRVGFNGLSPDGAIKVKAFRGGVATELDPFATPEKTFIGIEDTKGIDAIEISGQGLLYREFAFFIDDFRFGGTPDTGPEEIEVDVDIKPGNCLNPFNVKSRGKVPVVIIGRADFDVSQIDPASIRLSILEANLEDSMQSVTALREGLDDFGYCNAQEPDGFQDLKVKFDAQELVATLEYSLGEPLKDGPLVLQLSGNLYEEYGGTPIIGKDSIAILAKTKPKKHWKKHRKKRWKEHSKKHWKEHPKERSQKNWVEKLKEKWHAFIEKWKSKRDK